MKDLLEAGVHFGHQTHRWNPKMKRFIYGARNGIYIIDLHETLRRLEDAFAFTREIAANGGQVLFVGTKKQAQDAVYEAAQRCGMHFVTHRWLGGMMTNFPTIQQRIRRMRELRQMEADGIFERLPKKEVIKLREERAKLERVLAGMEHLRTAPEALFVVDVKKEHIAILEARRLDVPVIAIVDTNCDPDMVDYVIPANDDAIRAIRLIANKMADAIIDGRHEYDAKMTEQYGEAGYTVDMSPFRPLPEQVIEEVETEAEGTALAEQEEELVESATVELVDATEFVEEEEPIITEREKYFEVAKDYGAIGEED
jgi:small subunit ribosomal protein S2